MKSSALVLFRSVGKAIVEKGLAELVSGQDFGLKLQEVNGKVYEYFHKGCKGLRYLDVVAAIAATEAAEAKEISTAVVRDFQEDPSLSKQLATQDVRDRLLAYLEQIPVSVQNIFRRPSDPTGRTVPPDFRISRPEELLALLPAKAPRFRVGDRPVGDWELNQLLGIGAFGEVWKAVDAKNPNQANVALKFCLTPESMRYLRHETGLLQRIVKQVGEKKGIVQLRQAWLDAEPPCLEYEYVNGGDLCGLMSEWLNLQPDRRVKLALQMLQRLAKTVASLHEMSPPIVHRDLKPANVLIARSASGKFDLKISDFGIGGLAAGKALEGHASGVSQAEILTQTLRGSHTPMYAGPEQQGGAPPHPSDDVHALGVIGFQLLVCDLRRGPSGDWDEELRERAVPEAAIAVLRRCLARQSRRFQNAGEFQTGLDLALQGGRMASEPPSGYLLPLPMETVQKTLPVDPPGYPSGNLEGFPPPIAGQKPAPAKKLESMVHPEPVSSPDFVPPLSGKDQKASKIIRQLNPPVPDLIPADPGNMKRNQKVLTRGILFGAVSIFAAMLVIASWILGHSFQTPPKVEVIAENRFLPKTPQLPLIIEEGDNNRQDVAPERNAGAGKHNSLPDAKTITATAKMAKAVQTTWSQTSGLLVENSVQLTNGQPLRLVLIPPGKFLMGSPEDENERREAERQHWVTITQPFYISKFEISQEEWKAVMGNNPSSHAASGAARDKVPLNTGTYPVEEVSFNNALDFCQKLPELNGWKALLPTEAEWEYACRAGSDTVFPWGNSLNGERANCDGRYPYGVNEPGPRIDRPVEVGCYTPNAWGIHDMIGNVHEWCLDSYLEFDGITTTDPVYINHNGKRVSRGGSWESRALACRSAHRIDFDAFSGNSGVGIRVIYKKHDPAVNYREPIGNQPQVSKPFQKPSSPANVKREAPSNPTAPSANAKPSTAKGNPAREDPPKNRTTFLVSASGAKKINDEKIRSIRIGKLSKGNVSMVAGKTSMELPVKGSGNNQYEMLQTDGTNLGFIWTQADLSPGSIYSAIVVIRDPVLIASPKTPKKFSEFFVATGIKR